MNILNIISLLVICLIAFTVFLLLFKSNRKTLLTTLDSNLKERRIFDYNKTQQYIQKMGLTEIVNINASEFLLIKLSLGLILFFVFLNKNILMSLFFLILGYFIPNLLLAASNHSDNEEILGDLKRVYDTLRIQTKAGVFLTNALAECYLVAKNSRFKKALLELNNDILTKNDIYSAIDSFDNKFSNQYLDTFSIVLKQSVDSGKTVQILKDLSEQIKDIEEAVNIKLAQKIKAKLEILQFFIYIGIIAIIVYGIFMELLGNLAAF